MVNQLTPTLTPRLRSGFSPRVHPEGQATKPTTHNSRPILSPGFTLIEVLIVVSLLALIFIVGANLFFSTLKGASKAEIVKEIKQNGNYALGVMERMIRNSREIDCSTPNRVTITNPDLGVTTFLLGGSNRIASESALGTQFLTTSLTPASSFSISCSPVTPGVPTEVTIQFRLTQPGGLTRTEETAQVGFQTQVSTRNF